ncbi:hypothetical protein JCM5296_000979 [Sporobolomyces johnsonii]
MPPKRTSTPQDAESIGFELNLNVYDPPLIAGMKRIERGSKGGSVGYGQHGRTFDRDSTVAELQKTCQQIIFDYKGLDVKDASKLKIELYTPRSSYCKKESKMDITGRNSPITTFANLAVKAGHVEGTVVVRVEYELPADEGEDDSGAWEDEEEEDDGQQKKKGSSSSAPAKGKGKAPKKGKHVEPSPYATQNAHRGAWVTKLRVKHLCRAGCKNSFRMCIQL